MFLTRKITRKIYEKYSKDYRFPLVNSVDSLDAFAKQKSGFADVEREKYDSLLEQVGKLREDIKVIRKTKGAELAEKDSSPRFDYRGDIAESPSQSAVVAAEIAKKKDEIQKIMKQMDYSLAKGKALEGASDTASFLLGVEKNAPVNYRKTQRFDDEVHVNISVPEAKNYLRFLKYIEKHGVPGAEDTKKPVASQPKDQKEPDVKKEKKPVNGWLVALIVAVILGASGYAAYNYYEPARNVMDSVAATVSGGVGKGSGSESSVGKSQVSESAERRSDPSAKKTGLNAFKDWCGKVGAVAKNGFDKVASWWQAKVSPSLKKGFADFKNWWNRKCAPTVKKALGGVGTWWSEKCVPALGRGCSVAWDWLKSFGGLVERGTVIVKDRVLELFGKKSAAPVYSDIVAVPETVVPEPVIKPKEPEVVQEPEPVAKVVEPEPVIVVVPEPEPVAEVVKPEPVVVFEPVKPEPVKPEPVKEPEEELVPYYYYEEPVVEPEPVHEEVVAEPEPVHEEVVAEPEPVHEEVVTEDFARIGVIEEVEPEPEYVEPIPRVTGAEPVKPTIYFETVKNEEPVEETVPEEIPEETAPVEKVAEEPVQEEVAAVQTEEVAPVSEGISIETPPVTDSLKHHLFSAYIGGWKYKVADMDTKKFALTTGLGYEYRFAKPFGLSFEFDTYRLWVDPDTKRIDRSLFVNANGHIFVADFMSVDISIGPGVVFGRNSVTSFALDARAGFSFWLSPMFKLGIFARGHYRLDKEYMINPVNISAGLAF